jgi:hypothetical protein
LVFLVSFVVRMTPRPARVIEPGLGPGFRRDERIWSGLRLTLRKCFT